MHEELVRRATDLGVYLGQNAARIENEGRIPEDVRTALVDSGLFRITLPRELGGYGLSPRTLWEVVFAIAAGCHSTAWVVSLVGANVLMLGRFARPAQAAIVESKNPVILTFLTGGVGENVLVTRVPGGVKVSGSWRYASGIDIATWTGLLVNFPGRDGEPPTPKVVLVPSSAFSVDHGSWNVTGMRGTGSKRASLTDTFAPDDFVLDWAELQAGGGARASLQSFPVNVLFAMSVLAPTLGVALAIADECRNLMRSRSSDKASQIDLASSMATLDLLRTNLLTDTASVVSTIESGADVDVDLRALMRMKIAVSARLALQTAQGLLSQVGGSLLPRGTRIERAFRDIHAMSTHFLLQPAPSGEAYGRLALGLDLPGGARL
jgi:3-hydroxy-9,10-secoandrosta-1,3,5(10)-triene-9,17-dione monooxygenase